MSYPVLIDLSASYPGLRGRLPTRYSPVRHSVPPEASFRRPIVQLACMMHAASVSPEPGSNSPLWIFELAGHSITRERWCFRILKFRSGRRASSEDDAHLMSGGALIPSLTQGIDVCRPVTGFLFGFQRSRWPVGPAVDRFRFRGGRPVRRRSNLAGARRSGQHMFRSFSFFS